MLMPITRREFREAKLGRIIRKRFRNDECDFCVMMTNRFIRPDEAKIMMIQGMGILPLDITGLSWYDLNRRYSTHIVEYENGIKIALVSQTIFNQLEREK